jgi:hypothetical protein
MGKSRNTATDTWHMTTTCTFCNKVFKELRYKLCVVYSSLTIAAVSVNQCKTYHAPSVPNQVEDSHP